MAAGAQEAEWDQGAGEMIGRRRSRGRLEQSVVGHVEGDQTRRDAKLDVTGAPKGAGRECRAPAGFKRLRSNRRGALRGVGARTAVEARAAEGDLIIQTPSEPTASASGIANGASRAWNADSTTDDDRGTDRLREGA